MLEQWNTGNPLPDPIIPERRVANSHLKGERTTKVAKDTKKNNSMSKILVFFVCFVVKCKSCEEYQPMKRNIFVLFLTLLLIPAFTGAKPNKTIEIQGIIGDFAPDGRIYEVSGKLYKFDQDVTIQSQDGTVLTFADLKGGTEIKIIGEKIFDPKNKAKEKIKYLRIIVLKKH